MTASSSGSQVDGSDGYRHHNPGIRIVLHCHDHAVVDFDRDRLAPLLGEADLILACSAFLAGAIRRRFPAVAARCHALHNGVDASFLDARAVPAASSEILFVGRLSPEKGVHVLVDAFAGLARKAPEATLRLVGPADLAPRHFVDPFGRDPAFADLATFYGQPRRYQQELHRRARAVEGRVEFAGRRAHATVADELGRAGIFCFPSIWQEPFGMPLIEAMAAGLPVVATRHGAFPEIVVHGETGLLVERGDAGALGGALLALLRDPRARERMGRAARRRAARLFTWDHTIERLEALLDGTRLSTRRAA
ncbi:MAG: glycosyltransferase family 4 protein [Geminicoccaceae bacterium]